MFKVQYKGLSSLAIINSGFPDPGDYITFIAYSDQMIAAILRDVVNGHSYYISPYSGPKMDGEWYAQLDSNAKLLKVT